LCSLLSKEDIYILFFLKELLVPKIYFLFFAALFVCSYAVDCVGEVEFPGGKKYKYDFSKNQIEDMFYYIQDEGSYIYVNICHPSHLNCREGTAVCHYNYEKYESLGMLSTQKFDKPEGVEPGMGVSITYNGGDACTTDNYQTMIVATCDNSTTGEIRSVLVGECWYKVFFASKFACGVLVSENKESTSTAGETAAIIVLVLLLVTAVLYFGLGAVYQKKTKDPGTLREYIIHNEFWCAIPGLIKDGVLFIAHGFRKGDYISV